MKRGDIMNAVKDTTQGLVETRKTYLGQLDEQKRGLLKAIAAIDKERELLSKLDKSNKMAKNEVKTRRSRVFPHGTITKLMAEAIQSAEKAGKLEITTNGEKGLSLNAIYQFVRSRTTDIKRATDKNVAKATHDGLYTNKKFVRVGPHGKKLFQLASTN